MTGFNSKRQASRDLLEQALDALMCCSPDSKVSAALQIKTVKDLRAALAQPPATSADYAIGYAEGFNDACRPKPAAVAEPLSAEQEKYADLLYAVGLKWPGETRHQTALRYTLQAEQACQPKKQAHGIGIKGGKT